MFGLRSRAARPADDAASAEARAAARARLWPQDWRGRALRLAGLAVAGLGLGAAIAPWTVSRTALREEIAAQLRSSSGLYVFIEGPSTFSLLPSPHVKLGRVNGDAHLDIVMTAPASASPATRERLFAFLETLGIATTTVEHQAVFTVAESDALERDLRRLARQPHLGSLRFAYELGIPGLRAWPLHRFPYVVFYVEQASNSMSGASCTNAGTFPRPSRRRRTETTLWARRRSGRTRLIESTAP